MIQVKSCQRVWTWRRLTLHSIYMVTKTEQPVQDEPIPDGNASESGHNSKPAPPAGKPRKAKVKSKDKQDTPAMRQFKGFKEQYPDCVLFFRMGDFYEMFYDDAKLASRVLGVTLTQRSAGVPMAGVPFHAVEGYLRRMIQAGHRVAVCDQVEDAAQAKGVVKRDVTRLITPGTLTDESMLDEGQIAPLAAVMFHGQVQTDSQSRDHDAPGTNGKTGQDGKSGDLASVAWAELSTGVFQMATFEIEVLADELARIGPSELLYCETVNQEPPERVSVLSDAIGCPAVARPAWQYRHPEAVETLCKQFKVTTLAGFGLEGDELSLGPAGAVIGYLNETQRTDRIDQASMKNGANANVGAAGRSTALSHLQPPKLFARQEHLMIDLTSLRSLEIERTVRSGGVEGSLLHVLQSCRTAMGKRMLRQWLCYPLRDRFAIENRQRIVGAMVEDTRFLESLRAVLDEVQDIQRIVSRIAVNRASPRDLVALGSSCGAAQRLVDQLAQRPAVAMFHDELQAVVDSLMELNSNIAAACIETPPAHMREGGLIIDGFDDALDEYRSLMRDSNTWLAGYQAELIEETGVAHLKVGFNKVFGYYIELSAANRDKAPDNWTRKQTLKNAERFITPQLKEYEGKVLSAKERAVAREQAIFSSLCDQTQLRLPQLHALADAVAQLDVLACFAVRAVRHRYVKPIMVDDPVLHIQGGRHPVLDELLGEQFVPNDCELGVQVATTREESGEEQTDEQSDHGPENALGNSPINSPKSLALITGPNMAGKSTYIRQTALITLLAHTGSFVPADEAIVGLCDRIFTRIGASDELHAGQSTFMVEMTETANICHHATAHSLVILDEIGRGTSTLDGLSLAWAIAEHLTGKGSRTLFATHYHELTQLAHQYDNVTNLNVTVREWDGQIVFLHRIVPGATNRSYGIHVAKIAGLPKQVVSRADELLAQLAVSHNDQAAANAPAKPAEPVSPGPQMSLFTEYMSHPVLDDLAEIDINTLSPMQAFEMLRQMKDRLEGSDG
jgi:DNA mismatch repair protein MutS